MHVSIYKINKGINKPIAFRGLKAQYIGYLAVGPVAILVLFAVLYLCGVPTLLCLALAVALTTVLFMFTSRLSHRYGEHGLHKHTARRSVPRFLKIRSRKLFTQLTSKP